MQGTKREKSKRLWVLVALSALVVILDQVSKYLCTKFIELNTSVIIIPKVLRFSYIRNRGAAFGSLADNRWVFMIASVIMIGLIVGYVVKAIELDKVSLVALSVIVGGGIGNMIDRVAYGFVVDFIDVIFIPGWHWVFNVADAFVCVGATVLVITFIVSDIKTKKGNKNHGNDDLQG